MYSGHAYIAPVSFATVHEDVPVSTLHNDYTHVGMKLSLQQIM